MFNATSAIKMPQNQSPRAKSPTIEAQDKSGNKQKNAWGNTSFDAKLTQAPVQNPSETNEGIFCNVFRNARKGCKNVTKLSTGYEVT